MASDLVLRPRDATGFCAKGGGAWPAIQGLIEFLATNILAHAATIRIPAGSNMEDSFRRVVTALVLPVSAGDAAFRALGRWMGRWMKSKRLIPEVGGKGLDAAAVSGAVAICVPLEFAPLLAGRWEQPQNRRRVVLLDGGDFWHSYGKSRNLPFTLIETFPRYVPFIVSSKTKFGEKYKKKTISPSSSALAGVVAVVQIVLSIRQLYLNYGSSITGDGLSSPYLVVIPYILMSLVNLSAGILVNSYRQVTVLPMEVTKLPDVNEAYMVCLENCPEIVKCQEPQRILSRAAKSPLESAPGDSQTASKPTKTSQVEDRPRILLNKGCFLKPVD